MINVQVTTLQMITNFIMKYPQRLFKSIVNDVITEQYANIALSISIIFFIVLMMYFALFCCLILLIKLCWVVLQGITYWFFGRDKLREYLSKQNEEERIFLREMFAKISTEIKEISINKNDKSLFMNA